MSTDTPRRSRTRREPQPSFSPPSQEGYRRSVAQPAAEVDDDVDLAKRNTLRLLAWGGGTLAVGGGVIGLIKALTGGEAPRSEQQTGIAADAGTGDRGADAIVDDGRANPNVDSGDPALREKFDRVLDSQQFRGGMRRRVPGANPNQETTLVDGRWTRQWSAGGITATMSVEPRYNPDGTDRLEEHRTRPGQVDLPQEGNNGHVVLARVREGSGEPVGTIRQFSEGDTHNPYDLGPVILTSLYEDPNHPYIDPNSPGFGPVEEAMNGLYHYASLQSFNLSCSYLPSTGGK